MFKKRNDYSYVSLGRNKPVAKEVIKSEKSNNNDLAPCIANGGENTKFEDFKSRSEYLKEPLASELENNEDHFSNDAVQLLKFHGSYQQDNRENRKKGEGKDWQMMLRLRSPGGRIPPGLFIALDQLSNELGNGTLRATTRQAFQMHGIRKENLREVIGTIIKTMGSTLAACGDINRNVLAPAAPYQEVSYLAAQNLANEIADLLTPTAAEGSYLDLWVDGDLSWRIKPSPKVNRVRQKQKEGNLFSGDLKEPLYGSRYMPRKFKCAVTVPGDNSVDLLTNDIGLVVFTNKKGRLLGCNVYVGGGMGRTHNNETTFARTADPLGYIDAENILDLIQSILALQRDYGNRKTRRNARMKYLLHRHGLSWFKKTLLRKYFLGEIKPIKDEPKAKLEDYLGWHRQSSREWFVGIPLLSGRLNKELKNNLRVIIEKFQLEIRLTPNQDILLCDIGNQQKSSVRKALVDIGIDNPDSIDPIKKHALACPALPLCGLAMTEAERILPSILDRIKNQLEQLKIKKPILIRLTGCPNGCARPYMAELALVGSGVDQYQLWLGGTPNLQKLAKPYIQRMPLDELEKTIEPLLLSWKQTSCKKSFGKHIEFLGDQEVMRLLSQKDASP